MTYFNDAKTVSGIEKALIINRNELNNELYFESLLQKAYELQLLSDSDLERIQLECLALLAHKTEQYNHGDSSSIRIEKAESIMKSNLYTISLALKAFRRADDALDILKETSIKDIYQKGKIKIDTKLKIAKHIFNLTLKNKLNTPNETYNSTVVDGINGFFKIYDPDFEAYEIHITADYPLFNDVTNSAGIEFIQEYLHGILMENTFCQYFLPEDIHHLLCGYDSHYEELVFNIFEQVLTCSLGCIAAGVKPDSLLISGIALSNLEDIFYRDSIEQTGLILERAVYDLIKELNISNSALQNYIKSGLHKITANVKNAIKTNTLDKVFIKPEYPENNPEILVSFSSKMDNEIYRKLLIEINDCRYSEDKILLIKQNVKGLGDLIDVMTDAELTENEIAEILGKLTPVEIAAIKKFHDEQFDYDITIIKPSESKLISCLNSFLQNKPDDYNKKLHRIIQFIKIE